MLDWALSLVLYILENYKTKKNVFTSEKPFSTYWKPVTFNMSQIIAKFDL